MKNECLKPVKLDSIAELHRKLGLPGSLHPLVSLLDVRDGQVDMSRLRGGYISGFYKISLITKLSGKFRYGQGYYDFDEGSILFTAPNQVVGGTDNYAGNEGYSLIIHPNFLQGYPLARKIKNYGFFSYAINEALHLSEQEKLTLLGMYNFIREELNNRIDEFSREVVIAQIELLLSYARRFYKRQFLTRNVVTNNLLQQLEELFTAYFEREKRASEVMLTVRYLADQLHYTPNYLSDMLRSLTGMNAQQHIHQKVIERSKELLSSTDLTIGEVAYELGFEHPQSFSRLFKMKTKVTPVEFRQNFN